MSSASAQRNLVTFRAAGRSCALPLEAVQEVVPLAALSRPPGLPWIIEGLLNLDGSAVPVLRFDRLLGLPEQDPGLHSQLVVLRAERPIALLVESAGEVLPATDEMLMPVRATETFNGCLEAELLVGDRVYHLFSAERLLLEQERKKLEEFREMEQKRLEGLMIDD